ncbi:MAG: hypothetical protein R2825_05570 [Saprospiraceae bacterium]
MPFAFTGRSGMRLIQLPDFAKKTYQMNPADRLETRSPDGFAGRHRHAGVSEAELESGLRLDRTIPFCGGADDFDPGL